MDNVCRTFAEIDACMRTDAGIAWANYASGANLPSNLNEEDEAEELKG